MARCALPVLLLFAASGCNRVFGLLEVDDVVLDARSDDASADARPDSAPLEGCVTDDFEAASIGPQWTVVQTSTLVAQEGGLLAFSLQQIANVNFTELRSATRDMTSDTLSIEVAEAPNAATLAEAGLSMQMASSERIQLFVTNGQLIFRITTNSTNDDTFTSFNLAMHRYWQIRHAGGNIFWETSTNRVQWDIHRMVPEPFPVTAVTLIVFGGTYRLESQVPGGAKFDNLIVQCF